VFCAEINNKKENLPVLVSFMGTAQHKNWDLHENYGG